ncbi:MAG TPA: hypothetical protein VH374_04885 [Polyangia bacterium]|nr:hypothetical protein [Polyangia bacterium]
MVAIAVAVSLPAVARAASEGERADAALSAAATNRILGKVLPVAYDLAAAATSNPAPTTPSPDAGPAAPASVTVWLVDARYCGVAEGGRGRMVGVVRSTEARLASSALDGAATCAAKLDDLLKRDAIAAAGDAAVVSLLLAPSEQGGLRISIGALAAGPGVAPVVAAALAHARTTNETIRVIDTTARVLTFPGLPPQAYDVAIRFLKGDEGVALRLMPSATPPGHAPPTAAPPEALAIPEGSDGALRASFALGNRLLAQATRDGPLTVDVQGQAIDVTALRADGADHRLAVRGRATPRGLGESAHIAVEATGADLRVAEVRAEADNEDCAAYSMMAALGCRARNTARQAAAATLAGELTRQFGGQVLRTLAPIPPAALTLGPRRLQARLRATRLSASGSGLTAAGTIEFDPL